MIPFWEWCWHILMQNFLPSMLLILRVVGAVLSTAGCLAAPLANPWHSSVLPSPSSPPPCLLLVMPDDFLGPVTLVGNHVVMHLIWNSCLFQRLVTTEVVISAWVQLLLITLLCMWPVPVRLLSPSLTNIGMNSPFFYMYSYRKEICCMPLCAWLLWLSSSFHVLTSAWNCLTSLLLVYPDCCSKVTFSL